MGQIECLGKVLIASSALSGTVKNMLAKKMCPQKIFIFSFHVVYGRTNVYGISTGIPGMISSSVKSFPDKSIMIYELKRCLPGGI